MEDYTELLNVTRGDAEPTTGFIYVLRSTEGTVLYVGQTVQPLSVRMRGHFQDRPGLIRASAKLEAEEMWADRLLDTEAALIHKHHPVMNRQCPVTDCYHYINETIRRKEAFKPVLSDATLTDTIHTAIADAKTADIDRLFSSELLELIDAQHPHHNLKPGQIRQKVTAAIGSESRPIYDPATRKMARGWYLHEHT